MKNLVAGLAVLVVLIWALVVVAGLALLGFAAYRLTRVDSGNGLVTAVPRPPS